MFANSSTILPDGHLLGIGNALIDVTARVDEKFLRDHGFVADQAVKADNRHDHLLQTLEAQFKVQRSAGGSALNVLRAVQWVLKKPFVCTFMGCISSDETGAFLRNAAEDMGVRTACQTYSPLPCSMCIVLLTGTQRSLCSFQLASGKFEFDRFLEPSSQAHLEKAAFVYLSGFFLNVCTRTVLSAVTRAQESGKSVILDLGAPRICVQHAEFIEALIPFTDVLFGNDAEFAALGEALSFASIDIRDTCMALSKLQKAQRTQPAVVVMTRGNKPVIVTTASGSAEYACLSVPQDSIVDVNGAGDAFLGGFLSQFIQCRAVEECVAMGLYASSVVIQQSGCTFPNL